MPAKPWPRAQAFSDPQTGGFVSTLHNAAGTPIPVASGDRLIITSGSRSIAVHAADLKLNAHVQTLTGKTAPNSTVPLDVISPQGITAWHGVVTSGFDGTFSAALPVPLQAGSEAIATLGDAAGDQQAVTAFVPGLQVDKTTGQIHGWTVGNGPKLSARIGEAATHPVPLKLASDGTFAATLPQNASAITIGSRWHHHTYTLPSLSVQGNRGSHSVLVHGPRGTAVDVTLTSLDVRSWTTAVHIGSAATASIRVPRG